MFANARGLQEGPDILCRGLCSLLGIQYQGPADGPYHGTVNIQVVVRQLAVGYVRIY